MPFFAALLALIQPVLTWLTITVLPWFLTSIAGIIVTRLLLGVAYMTAVGFALNSLLGLLSSNIGLLPTAARSALDYFGVTIGLNIIISTILYKQTLKLATFTALR
jgi:hypothetical protein